MNPKMNPDSNEIKTIAPPHKELPSGVLRKSMSINILGNIYRINKITHGGRKVNLRLVAKRGHEKS